MNAIETKVDDADELVYSETYGGDVFTVHERVPDLVVCNTIAILKGDNIVGEGWSIYQVRLAVEVRGRFFGRLQARNEIFMNPLRVWLPARCQWKVIDGKWFVHRPAGEDECEGEGDDTWGPVPESHEIPIYRALIEAREYLDARAVGSPYPGAPKRKAWTLPPLPRGYDILAERDGVNLYFTDGEGRRAIWGISSCIELLTMMHLIEAYNRENRDDWQFIASGSFDVEQLDGDHRGYK